VPENVWEFHIGGYQVCEKWLKDRKGRTLSKDGFRAVVERSAPAPEKAETTFERPLPWALGS
jgi:hypothetical protein